MYQYDLKEYDQAIADYSRAIEIDPQEDFWLYARADVYKELEQYDQAIADYSRAIDPKDTSGYTLRASVYEKLEEYDQAIADYSRAIEIDQKMLGLTLFVL